MSGFTDFTGFYRFKYRAALFNGMTAVGKSAIIGILYKFRKKLIKLMFIKTAYRE